MYVDLHVCKHKINGDSKPENCYLLQGLMLVILVVLHLSWAAVCIQKQDCSQIYIAILAYI